jgi:phosphonate transport system substrate-binding protein
VKIRGIGAGTLLLLLLWGGVLSCKQEDPSRKVSFEKREAEPETAARQRSSLRIAVGGMITPRAGFRYYREFLDYIGERLGRPVEFVDREDYAEINKLVETGNVDAAFVCGGPYVDGRKQFGMELLVAPRAYGGTVYHSYIIVQKDSAIGYSRIFGEAVRLYRPAFQHRQTGPDVPPCRMGETPESFFSQYTYTQTHDKSIKAVAEQDVDGASVDSLIWEYANRTDSRYTAQTKIIERSEPFGIPPVVVSKHLDRETKKKLKEIFLTAHEDERGRAILKNMMIDRFVSSPTGPTIPSV